MPPKLKWSEEEERVLVHLVEVAKAPMSASNTSMITLMPGIISSCESEFHVILRINCLVPVAEGLEAVPCCRHSQVLQVIDVIHVNQIFDFWTKVFDALLVKPQNLKNL